MSKVKIFLKVQEFLQADTVPATYDGNDAFKIGFNLLLLLKTVDYSAVDTREGSTTRWLNQYAVVIYDGGKMAPLMRYVTNKPSQR